MKTGGILAVEARDVRATEHLWPGGLTVWTAVGTNPDFAIKEIVIVVPEQTETVAKSQELKMAHRYLLIYYSRK